MGYDCSSIINDCTLIAPVLLYGCGSFVRPGLLLSSFDALKHLEEVEWLSSTGSIKEVRNAGIIMIY